MSEEAKKTEEQRTKYSVNVEPMAFEADAESMTLTSEELCALTNEFFKAAFADYAGCKFEASQGQPVMSLYFDHVKHAEDDAKYYACDMVGSKTSGSTVIDRTRNYDRLVKEGDRYHLTDDGKDVIQPLLLPRFANRRNLNWGDIVADFVDRSNVSYFNPMNGGNAMTKVMYIDPNAICAKLFGDKGFSYSVQIRGDLYAFRNGFGGAANYVLNILKVDNDVITKTYKKLGVGVIGVDYVRA